MNIDRIFKDCIIDENGCWIWQKSFSGAGYRQLTEDKIYWSTHRYAYTCVNPELGKTQVVRHLCHNMKCCNPEHLKAGSQKDNWQDSKDVHKKAAAMRRSDWCIQGVSYGTIREAQEATGISQSSLVKHTKDGVFDVESYRIACKRANHIPKV